MRRMLPLIGGCMAKPKNETLPPLPDYFNATSVGDLWHLHCKRCDAGWALPKGNKHPGNVLALLNHARSHDAK
jgi:hypothetical protein